MRRWSKDELVAMANAVFWDRHATEMHEIGIHSLEELQDRHAKGKETVWHPGGDPDLPEDDANSRSNDPQVFAEELYAHEGVAILFDLERSIPETLREGSNFELAKKEG